MEAYTLRDEALSAALRDARTFGKVYAIGWRRSYWIAPCYTELQDVDVSTVRYILPTGEVLKLS